MRGFTGISESLEPEALREYINEYLTEMSTIIRDRHRGTLDKYIGDAIMAFWGAPVDDPQHARHAVLAALEMQRQCGALNARLRRARLAARSRSASASIPARSASATWARACAAPIPRWGTRSTSPRAWRAGPRITRVGILVGEATRSRVKDVVFREIDRIRVKGKDEAITDL